ncbi:hypothetical protein BV25DRAFT_1823488 [Artomyces pyxidatus]|uniref:Uncharacterized protein n=1 Tax=Artomyces pyxidatus TaxID=48021 RepID=A0ACB8T7L2_9AGAM|nr:hypothetical protein BV25DRAFT_1823488 [Artomyces pyxidatus]
MSRRDDLFPPGSIGRSAGSFIQRIPSPAPSLTPSLTREPLTAHPLLSPTPSPGPGGPATTASDASEVSATTKYVPYTPRHRTAATTGTTLQSSLSVSPQQPGGGATGKLQLMNLKAGAQSIGLDTSSVGWEILEKLVSEHDHNAEWGEVWNTLVGGKATLLLPLEQGPHSDITVEFVKDHIALCDAVSQDPVPIVTLSGLRGTLVGEILTLRSSVQPGTQFFEALVNPSTRATALAGLPPLPLISSSPLSQTYPTFHLPAHTDALPLPPHDVQKPPLPPRPNQRQASGQVASSRLSTSFASLFGKASTPSTPTPTPPPGDPEHAVEVAAYTIDRRIIRKDVSKVINKALKAEIKETLAMSGVPNWVVERVHDFTAGLYPFIKSKSPSKRPFANSGGVPPTPPFIIDPPQETVEELSHQFQEFYAELEDDLFAGHSPITARPKGDGFLETEQEKIKEKISSQATDGSVREVLEAVERVICTLFYDRLYLQPKCDDASHDEALSSRVAALNMLDLGMEHLGVEVGSAGPAVQLVLKNSGETLSKLELSTCRCPADKAVLLVAAHKILVDGLSRLPPIRLKSEAELEHQKTPEAVAAAFDPLDEPVDEQTSGLLPGIDPPPIVISPDSESQIHIPSPTKAEGPYSRAEPTSPSSMALPIPSSAPVSPSPPSSPTPVSGDIIVPLMIFAVVKSNPQHLVSHLLYTQRFRNQRFGGEESYCLVNLMAVADFLENVDLKALGLGDSEKKVMSTADLTPIPVTRAALQTPGSPQEGVPARLRRGVEQQVDAIAGSANKVILGVVDQGFGVLRAFLPGTPDPQHLQDVPHSPDQEAAPWNATRPAFGLLRRESGFSIASLAASLPGRERAKSFASTIGTTVEESGQMMVEVSSRPGSVRSAYASDADGSTGDDSDEGDEEDDEEYDEEDERHDARSIRSFESMMNKKGKKRQNRSRKSLTDRLASMPGLSRLSTGQQPLAIQSTTLSPPPSRRSSLLPPPRLQANRFDTPISSGTQSPVAIRIAPPNKRFLECTEDDIKVSEVKDLLREYRRIVDGLRAMGGFEE